MENLLEITVGQALRERAAKNYNKEFIVFPNRGIRYTFGDIDEKADALAKGLLAAGFKKGDHIGIWAHNIPEWAPLFYAIARAGFITVPVNVNCKHREIGYILGHADIKGLFFVEKYRDTDLAEILYQIIPELKNASTGNLNSSQFPCLKMVASIDNTARAGMYTLEDIVKTGSAEDSTVLQKAEAEVRNTDTLAIMYTSGTTGMPKGAMLTHRGMINSAYFAYKPGEEPDESAIVFNALPYFYITALSEGLLGGLLLGYKIVGLEMFDPIKSLEVIQNEQCSWVFGVPSIFLALTGNPRYHEFDTQCVKHICIGGTNCPAELLKNIFIKMKLESMYHVYGLTELSPFITDMVIKDPADPHLATVGNPLYGVEVSIRDSENNECPVNVEGEICVRGHGVMQGYYKMEEATRETIDGEGWLHTGDLGHLVEDGYLVIGGRIKELIIRSSENIYPKEVENLLLAMPGIHDAQVVGIPSEKYGEEVAAFVILKPDFSVSEQDVKDFCKERISFYKNPQYVFFTESFPLSGNGKVQKFKLSEMGLKILKEKGIIP
jgi:fatty-acyl-CoA synthase